MALNDLNKFRQILEDEFHDEPAPSGYVGCRKSRIIDRQYRVCGHFSASGIVKFEMGCIDYEMCVGQKIREA